MQAIRSRRTAVLCTAGAALSLAAFAPSAFAGTAQVTGGQFSYTAPGLEKNDVKLLQTSATNLRITEQAEPTKVAQSVTPGPGCVQAIDPLTFAVNPASVDCNVAGVTSGLVDVDGRSDVVRAFGVDIAMTILGGEGADNLQGGDQPDNIKGGIGDDFMDGNGGSDTLEGEDGNDRLRSAGSTPDTLICGAGIDSYEADPTDLIDASCEAPPAPPVGGTTSDPTTTVRQSDVARGTVNSGNLPAQKSGACDNEIFLTQGVDRKIGTGQGDMMFGLGGRDVLNGGSGDDCLLGGEGNDVLSGGSGNDRVEGQVGSDLLSGGNGNDGVLGAAGNDKITGGAGNDVLDGSAGRDSLVGGAGNDVLTGGAGNDSINGGSGRNVIGAGPGSDSVNSRNRKRETVNCGSGRDRVVADSIDRLVGCERISRR